MNTVYGVISERKLTFIFLFTVTEIRLIWNFLFGFRWPSAYVLSCNVFTYESGFMPRTFVASIMKLLFGNHIYSLKFLYILITGTSVLILLFFMYMSYYFNFRKRNLVGSILVLWYSLSIYSAYLSHEAGYFEQYAYVLLGVILLVSSRIKSPIRFTILCAGTGFVCLLISETNAFLVLPVLFIMNIMRLLESRPEGRRGINKRHLRKDFVFLVSVNIPSLLYCTAAGFLLVPESRVAEQLVTIRSHASYFEYLDEIGSYFYNSRLPVSYTHVLEFKVWNWQLKLYLALVVFTVTVALVSAKEFRKAVNYLVGITGILICIYCLNFIAWDTERFKFCAAMAVTFLSFWVIKETGGNQIIMNQELFSLLLVGGYSCP